MFKPCTSKSGNSEVYVICKNYIGIEDSDYLEHLSSVYFGKEHLYICSFSFIIDVWKYERWKEGTCTCI